MWPGACSCWCVRWLLPRTNEKGRCSGIIQGSGLFHACAVTISEIKSRYLCFPDKLMQKYENTVIFYRKGEHGYD